MLCYSLCLAGNRRSMPFAFFDYLSSRFATDYVHYYTNLFARLRDCFSANSFCSISTIGAISPLDLVPTSSRFRTLTERLSSSSCPTTELCEYAMSSRTVRYKKALLPRIKLYCAISPLRIFFGRVSAPLSTSAKRPRSVRRVAISWAYSFCKDDTCQHRIVTFYQSILTYGTATGITST
jgi:hypothetical protein